MPPPARPASTVLVVRQPIGADIEVLMVERPGDASFGGLMVFPGGAVEDCDRVPDRRYADMEFRVAGLRETAEEVGFIPTSTGFAQSPPLRGRDLIDSWSEGELDPAIDRMTLVSRWVTPRSQPVRFDTRFYLVDLEGDPRIVLDTSELEGHAWVTPERALDEARAGRWQLILPTWSHLRWLARWATVAEARRAAGEVDGHTVIEPIMREGRPVVRYRADT